MLILRHQYQNIITESPTDIAGDSTMFVKTETKHNAANFSLYFSYEVSRQRKSKHYFPTHARDPLVNQILTNT